jgi:low temperature requirement protein LtrA
MKARIIAWCVVIGVVWVASGVVSRWSNPWTAASIAVPVTAVMPQVQPCKEDCK